MSYELWVSGYELNKLKCLDLSGRFCFILQKFFYAIYNFILSYLTYCFYATKEKKNNIFR